MHLKYYHYYFSDQVFQLCETSMEDPVPPLIMEDLEMKVQLLI